MIYKLYYTDNNGNKFVRNIDDIHENNVWAVCQLWGTGIAVAEANGEQPADAADYQQVGEI